MKLEKTAAKSETDITRHVVKTAETLVRKTWTVLDAASEKEAPGEVLSDEAMRAIQGRTQG